MPKWRLTAHHSQLAADWSLSKRVAEMEQRAHGLLQFHWLLRLPDRMECHFSVTFDNTRSIIHGLAPETTLDPLLVKVHHRVEHREARPHESTDDDGGETVVVPDIMKLAV